MTEHTPSLQTKLPKVGTTIFTVMSALAAEKGAVNLGQGFPDFDCDPRLIQAVTDAMQRGHNQYPPMPGVPALREAVAAKVQALYGRAYQPATEITITAGATQAILTAILAVVRAGDEVIVLEPCYDSYVPNIELAGGVAVPLPLTPGTFRPDFDKITAALTPRTRAIIVNSPHNPSATVWTDADMRKLQEILAPTEVLLISDEVYEHMVYAPNQHLSAASYPGLAARAFIVSSFGKTYHVTGWKVGTVCAPAAMTARAWRKPAFACCPAKAAISSASISPPWRCPSATCPKPNSANGSRRRSVWRPSRCRPSTATASTRRSSASAMPRRTRRCVRR